jgi:carboxymethylenebutenolidase
MKIRERWIDVPAESGTMSVHIAEPEGAGPHPGLVSFHSFIGISDYRIEVSRRLAEKGYAVALPDLFHRKGKRLLYNLPEQENDAVATASSLSFIRMAVDSRVATNCLKSEGNVDAKRIGVLGFGMGGTVAFVAACSNSDLKCAAIAYSRNLVPGALSPGRPISPLMMVEDINCPVLFLSSSGDPVPSPADVKVLAAVMEKYKKQFEHQLHSADPPVGHAFMEQDIPQFYNAAAAAWGWPHIYAFLERHLQHE